MMDIYSLSLEEIVSILNGLGLERYRGDQIFDWLYRKQVRSFEEMTNLPREKRAELAKLFCLVPMERIATRASEDQTEKSIFRLNDGNTIESVLIKHPDHTTLCISTQVGCPVGCAFCATGQSGYIRNLTTGEIVYQAVDLERSMTSSAGINIVFMGMGEPLLNLDNVLKSVNILNNPKGRALGMRRFTISTVGIPEGIRTIAEKLPASKLSVSLHSPRDSVRGKLVPFNRFHGLKEIFGALRDYVRITGNRVTFEYVLIDGVNDSAKDAHDLAALLAGIPAYVNIIALNPTQGMLKRPSSERVASFCSQVRSKGLEAFVRVEKGSDIEAACGQLRLKHIEGGGFEKKSW